MKTKAISSLFVLFAIASVMAISAPDAFADHAEVTIVTVDGSGFGQDCAVSNGGSGCYSAMTSTVDVGGNVIMLNSDPTGAAHSFTSGTVDGFSPSPDGLFDSGVLAKDAAFEWSPEDAGTVPYYCFLHTWMIGEIIVQEVEDAHDEVTEDAHDEDVELMVAITDSQVLGGTQVELEFSELHVNYEITATQNSEEIFKEAAHAMEHTATHQIDAVGSDENPIDIDIVSLGIGAPGEEDSWTGPTGSVATSKVVPEFGTIAMMILAVAIISIVAVTAKSRVIPRF